MPEILLADALKLDKGLSIPGRAVTGGGQMSWARDAYHAWDFLNDQARFAGVYKGPLANTPNWSYTRSQTPTAYAQNAAGVLIPFATGVLRRTDKGVLIEGARTNLCLRSQDFDNASWVKNNCTVTADQFAAPDGTTTADKIEGAAGAGSGCQNYQAWTATATSFVYSVFVHQGSGATDANKAIVRNNTTATTLAAGTIDYSTGVFTQSTGTGALVQALGNGWWRVCLPVSSGVTATDVIRVYAGFSGVAETPGEYCYAWGAQIEAGVTFPSSYIPTTTASASRAADALVVTGLSGFDYPLTLFAEWERYVDPGAVTIPFQVDGGTNNDRACIEETSTDHPGLFVSSGGVSSVDMAASAATVVVGTPIKAAARVELNNCRVTSGTQTVADVVAAMPTVPPAALRFGISNGGGNPLWGYLRRAAIYTRALSDAELQSVST